MKTEMNTAPEVMPWIDENNENNFGVIYITKKGIGNESTNGKQILFEFFKNLIISSVKPEYIIFAGKSIELINENEKIKKSIFELEEYNTQIIICKESLIGYNININFKKAKIFDMQNIVEILLKSQKVLTI